MTQKPEIKTMDYGDKQYFIALRGIVEEKDDDNWEECEKELLESFETAQKAAKEENPIGQFNLAMHYDYGFGIEESDEEAFKWYEKAAQQGHSEAMHYTAWAYGHGRGIAPDMEKFYEWEKKAALAYYTESKITDAANVRDRIGSAVHAVLCYADGPLDEDVIALFAQMRNDPRVKEYIAERYSATPTFLDDLEQQLKKESLT